MSETGEIPSNFGYEYMTCGSIDKTVWVHWSIWLSKWVVIFIVSEELCHIVDRGREYENLTK